MTIRTLLVDDEALARQRMRELLSVHPDIEIVGECPNGHQARSVIEESGADLLMLDVNMPRMSGLRLLEVLGEGEYPLAIFVTAHDTFAVEAFDTRAVDYLLKPVRPERLRRALDRARQQLAAIRNETPPAEPRETTGEVRRIHRLMIRSNDRIVFLRSAAIDWIESAGNYAIVHAGSERHIVRETMASLEQGLPPDEFVRLSRSLIVNAGRIVELQSNGQGGYQAVLQGGKRVNVTVGLRELEQRLRFP